MGWVRHGDRRSLKAGGRRLMDRLALAWHKWTSPYGTNDNRTKYEVLGRKDG